MSQQYISAGGSKRDVRILPSRASPTFAGIDCVRAVLARNCLRRPGGGLPSLSHQHFSAGVRWDRVRTVLAGVRAAISRLDRVCSMRSRHRLRRRHTHMRCVPCLHLEQGRGSPLRRVCLRPLPPARRYPRLVQHLQGVPRGHSLRLEHDAADVEPHIWVVARVRPVNGAPSVYRGGRWEQPLRWWQGGGRAWRGLLCLWLPWPNV
mmetsp:Transcript_14820/g.44274  ORF Transcript_14820/g.44274 Transcript_14820/m.44274 type:complete len:206 (+) Transcript_14820:264-881(+)